MRLFFVLSTCFVLSISADAAKLSQLTKRFVERVTAAVQKTATPVKQGVAVVACGAMLCAFGVQSAHGKDSLSKFNKFALTGANRENVQSVGAELEFILLEQSLRGEAPFYMEDWSLPFSFGYVDAKVVSDGDNWHFPRVRGYLEYSYWLPPPLSSARGGGLNAEWPYLGYEYHDFRTHGFDNEATEGFVAHYLHLLGISNAGRLWKPGFPVLKSSIGGDTPESCGLPEKGIRRIFGR